jgi:membrane protein
VASDTTPSSRGLIGIGRFFWDSWQTFALRRGQIMAKGIAFAALFSLFGALATGFTAFALIVGTGSELYEQLVAGVADTLPGLLQTDANPDGAIDPATLIQPDAMSLGGIVGLTVALWGGLGWVDAMREGVRSMLDVPKDTSSIVLKKGWDVLMLALLGLGLLSSAVASVGASSAAGLVLELVGFEDSGMGRLAVRALSFTAVACVDGLLMMLILRRMSRTELPWHDIWPGVVFGAVAIGLLKQFAGVLLATTGGNPILATGAILVGLLFFLNLMSMAALFSAAMVHVRVDAAIRAQRESVGALSRVTLIKQPEPAPPQSQESSGRLRRMMGRLRSAWPGKRS